MKKNKLVVCVVFATVVVLALDTVAFADPVLKYSFNNDPKLHPLVKFIDWVVTFVQWGSSILVAIPAVLSGARYALSKNQSGTAEAKESMRKTIFGLIWINTAVMVVNYFNNQLNHILGPYQQVMGGK